MFQLIGGILGAITLFLASGGLASAKADTNETAKKEITSVIKAYEKALSSSSTPAVMALYSRDPVFMPQNSKALVGRDAVQAGYEQVFKTIKVNVAFTIHEIVELGDTAYVRTSSAGELEILAANAKVQDAYNELFIFQKDKGQWKIHRYIYSTSNPPASK